MRAGRGRRLRSHNRPMSEGRRQHRRLHSLLFSRSSVEGDCRRYQTRLVRLPGSIRCLGRGRTKIRHGQWQVLHGVGREQKTTGR